MFTIVSDIHLHNWSAFSSINEKGVNTRLESILAALKEAADATEKGERLYFAGDLFHVRGTITPSVLNPTLELFEYMIAKGIEPRLIAGNHDLESKNTFELTNALQSLKALGCEIVNETQVFIDDQIAMIPWLHDLTELKEQIRKIPNRQDLSLVIHAPLNGVISIPDNGFEASELEQYGFKRVFCGHYHNHKSFNDKVYSVGALTHQTWSDVDSVAGFLRVGNDVTHHVTSAPKFIDFNEDNTDECKGNFVRVKLEEATEKEVIEIRNGIKNDLEALDVIVKFTPKIQNVSRSHSIKSGESIENSIQDWIGDHVDKAFVESVNKECLSILEETISE